MTQKILILTSKSGGGHESPAQAIKQAFLGKFQVDIYDGLPSLADNLYFYIHHFLPTFFNLSYKLTDNKLGAKILHFFSFLFTLKVLNKVSFEDYDLIISVQPFLTSEIGWLTNKPFIIFITEPLKIHQVWICPKANFVFVATEEGKEVCIKKGLPEEKIIVSGFPVRKQFFKKLAKRGKSKFTVFIGGSGYGLRETKTVIKNLKNSNIQAIVVCGINKSLQKNLPKRENIKVFGFVKNMAELMTRCNLVVSKAGSSLLFESIILGIPFLATGYPPEHEKGNLKLIKKYRVGFVEENPKKAAKLINNLAQNPKELERFTPNIQKLAQAHQNAPKTIALKISYLLKNSIAAKRR